VRLVLQVVVLAEQVLLLLARKQRNLVQARQVRRQPRRTPRLPALFHFGHWTENRVVGTLTREARVIDEVQRQFLDPLGPHLVDNTVNGRLRAVVVAAQFVDRYTAP